MQLHLYKPKRTPAKKEYYPIPNLAALKNQIVLTYQGTKEFLRIGYFNSDGVFLQEEVDPEAFQTIHSLSTHTPYPNFQDFYGRYLSLTNPTDHETLYLRSDSSRYWAKFNPSIPTEIGATAIQRNWARIALRTLIPQVSTLDDFVIRYNFLVDHEDYSSSYSKTDTALFHKQYPPFERQYLSITSQLLAEPVVSKEVRNFVYRIELPKFERIPENTNKNTFDYIRIFLSIPTKQTCSDRITFVNQHKEEIMWLALERISKTKSFQKYGVPINILQLEQAIITAQSQLELLFGVKGLEKNVVEEKDFEEELER